MPIGMTAPKIFEIGTSLFMFVYSGHYDLPDRNNSVVTTASQVISAKADTTTTAVKAEKAASSVQPKSEPVNADENSAYNFTASTISVSCIKLTWDCDEDLTVSLMQLVPDEYIDNVHFEFKSNTLCYVTGLREGTEYQFNLSDDDGNLLTTTTGRTETVEVIQEFPYEDGWTNCFTYENAQNLTKNPSWSAIQGAVPDMITNTGIMRDEYGDYCCAMGTFYGYCGDRFIVSLENGTQFTVKICDSKGDRRYHNFGNGGKSVIEFIHADGFLPDCTAFSGNYGYYNWCGLDLGANIESIKKINYGETVEY